MAAHPPSANRFAGPCAATSAAATWRRAAVARRAGAERALCHHPHHHQGGAFQPRSGRPHLPCRAARLVRGAAQAHLRSAIHTHFHQWIGEQQRTAETGCWPAATSCQQRVVPLDGSGTFTPLYEIRRQRLIDGRPCSTSATICWRAAFGIANAPWADSLTELYRQRYGIGRGWASLEITPSAARGDSPRPQPGGERRAAVGAGQSDDEGKLVDCDIEHWRPDAIRICLDTAAGGQTANRSPPARGTVCNWRASSGRSGVQLPHGGSRRIHRDQLSMLGIRSSKLW